jgi:hypothetical protein
MTWTERIVKRLRETNSPYADFVHDGLEWQIQPTEEEALLERWQNKPYRIRIPKHGRTIPQDNDGPVSYPPLLVTAAGTSWWNWWDGVTEACFFDFDYGHGGKALDEAGIAKVDEWAARLPYVMCCSSRSGRGRHWLVRLATPLPAATRDEHTGNCGTIKDQVCKDLGFDIGPYVCSFGCIQYIYANPEGK